MSKYTIAWMPGDGVGNDVMEGTRIGLMKDWGNQEPPLGGFQSYGR